jgi:hypothetical protein
VGGGPTEKRIPDLLGDTLQPRVDRVLGNLRLESGESRRETTPTPNLLDDLPDRVRLKIFV